VDRVDLGEVGEFGEFVTEQPLRAGAQRAYATASRAQKAATEAEPAPSSRSLAERRAAIVNGTQAELQSASGRV